MANRLNLARRPFVDTRPVNVTVAVLALAAAVLTFASWRTVTGYYAQSARTRNAIAALKSELDGLESKKHAREIVLTRYDVGALAASARDANAITRLKAFSWSRFLTRLEATLPADDRIASIALSRPDSKALEAGVDAYGLSLAIVSRNPEALPRDIRVFYASPWFDHPIPLTEQSPEKGKDVGWRILLNVTYLDGGKK